MQQVCLGVIAKDEEDTVRRLIASAFEAVDRVLLVDTGSRDHTIRAAEAAADDYGLPITIRQRPWRGFAHNRTELLRLADGFGGGGYLLMLDADHKLTVDGDRPELTADSYMVKVDGGGLRWRLPLLTRIGHPFEYRGTAHAYLASDAPTVTEDTEWLSVDGGDGASTDKLEADYVRLCAEPVTPRSVFYRAETARFLGRVEDAIAWYEMRGRMTGYDEERYWAKLQLGILLGENVSLHEALPVLAEAFREWPHRAETLRAVANLATTVADKLPLAEGLFVRPADYTTAGVQS